MAKLTLETAVANGFHWKKCAMKNINYNYSKYSSSRVYVGIQLERWWHLISHGVTHVNEIVGHSIYSKRATRVFHRAHVIFHSNFLSEPLFDHSHTWWTTSFRYYSEVKKIVDAFNFNAFSRQSNFIIVIYVLTAIKLRLIRMHGSCFT